MTWRRFIAACALLVQSATASAQTAVPVVGLLSSRSEGDSPTVVEDLRKGLQEAGYAEPASVRIEYRWADGRYDRLQGLAAELVGRHVPVLVTTGGIVSALAAKQATSVVPIVFTVGDDPVRHGLVVSLNRPGGNATGVVIMAADLGSKRLELVHEMVPSASHVAILVNPANPNMDARSYGLRDTASKLGLRLTVLSASHHPEIDTAFETMARKGLARFSWARTRSCMAVGIASSRSRHGIRFRPSTRTASSSGPEGWRAMDQAGGTRSVSRWR